MSFALPFDPLLLLLDDPALLAAVLAPPEPGLAAPVPTAAPPPTPPDPPVPPVIFTEDAFPSTEELDALLAESHQAETGPDLALREELAAMLGIDPLLAADEAAFMAALSALEPPTPEELPEALSGEPTWGPAWSEPVREDWPLG